MKFNEKLFELRKEKGYSQEELADKLNVARQTISKWENGTTTPDFDNLIELSKLFEISIDEFVGNDFKKENLIEESNDKNLIVDENIEKIKNKKRKLKKVFLSLFLICIFIISTIYGIKVIKRYKIVDAISKRMVLNLVNDEKDRRKQEFYFVKSVTKYEKFRLMEWEREEGYSRDYNFKKDYYYLEIEPNINGGNPRIIRTEYIDGDEYYDIDNIEMSYKKGEYEHEDYYYMAGNELDIAILNEIDFSSIGNKLTIALNPLYKIDIKTTGNNYKEYCLSRNGNYKDDINLLSISTSVSEENVSLFVNISDTKDSIGDIENYTYMWVEKEITDEEIAFPDLTGFTIK